MACRGSLLMALLVCCAKQCQKLKRTSRAQTQLLQIYLICRCFLSCWRTLSELWEGTETADCRWSSWIRPESVVPLPTFEVDKLVLKSVVPHA